MTNKIYPYKLSILKNPRYIFFLFLLALIFCVNLFFFYFYKNYLFLIISVLALAIFSYVVFKSESIFSQSINIYDDHLEYKRSKFETEKIYYRDIKLAGYYKKDLSNFNKYSFGDGLFLYDDRNDKYILIGIGFDRYKEIYKKLEEKSSQYKFKWHNIKRERKTYLLEELKKLV
ncbi:MAG TPA: hypothetical protein PLE45_10165 [Spirochaetota bacterium]|nr:hypothetical protein [Spirochaetota bacterium]HOL57449.1 hypothetical protein [Spirochaetota bacterium]HPP03625.1 hypothetical protein [Spirochaetota bacterium]